MASRNKTVEEIRKQIEELKIQEKQALKRENEKKRKERTKRLIERGAILENAFGIDENVSNDNLQKALIDLMNTPSIKSYIMSILKPNQVNINNTENSVVDNQE